MVHAVEKRAAAKINDPVGPPAAFPAHRHRVQPRRPQDSRTVYPAPLHRSPRSSQELWLTTERTQTTRPLRSRLLTRPSPLLRGGPPPCRASVLSPAQISCLGVSLLPASVNTPAS